MAIFEQQISRKVLLDDTEPITCQIENWQNVDGHTVSIVVFNQVISGHLLVIIIGNESIMRNIVSLTSSKYFQEFIIKVHRGPFSNQTWKINKRYNDFFKLHQSLQISGIPLELPPKKLIGNMDPQFISERQRGLQVNNVLSV